MTFVLNKCFGGFSLSQFAADRLGLKSVYDFDGSDLLIVDALASLITEYGSEKCSGRCAKLKVVTIPDNCTDYEINDYDGVESITYVVDGKLYHA